MLRQRLSFGIENPRSLLCLIALILCNCTGRGTCPPHGHMVNGAPCRGEDLQCPREITITRCDGTEGSVTSSCSCVNDAWVCPEPGVPDCSVADASASGAPSSTGTSTLKLPPRSSGSSCPFVFVWNGSSFEYETDLGGITVGLPPGVTANAAIPLPTAGTFYAKLSHAQFDSQSGVEIHLRETVREISYLDQIRLVVVDHPAGYDVWGSGEESTNEWGYVNPLKFYTSQGARALIAAADQNGTDVTRYLVSADNAPAPISDNALDSYTLDFGPLQHPESAKLLIDGWSIYAIAADQDVQPFVEAQDSQGNWVMAQKFGAPYGDFKTIVVELGGKLPADARKLRVNLGLENGARWVIDQVRLDESTPVPVTTAYLDPVVASLVHRGRATLHRCTYLSRAEALDDENPDDPGQYGYGNFTRYGDVRDLLTQLDDQLVIMRHGDQITLQFPGLTAPAAGSIRTLFLQSDVTMKSFILGTSVEPLPFHGMSTYPYPSTEAYPADAAHQNYRDQYNTRVFLLP